MLGCISETTDLIVTDGFGVLYLSPRKLCIRVVTVFRVPRLSGEVFLNRVRNECSPMSGEYLITHERQFPVGLANQIALSHTPITRPCSDLRIFRSPALTDHDRDPYALRYAQSLEEQRNTW